MHARLIRFLNVVASDFFRMTRLPLACAVMLLPVMVAGSVYGAASTQRENAAESGRIERARRRAFARRANNYLVNMCGADGRFTYRIMLNPQTTVSERYNMLRHAGTMSAMIASASDIRPPAPMPWKAR